MCASVCLCKSVRVCEGQRGRDFMSPPDLENFMSFCIRPKDWSFGLATVYFSVHYVCVCVWMCVCLHAGQWQGVAEQRENILADHGNEPTHYTTPREREQAVEAAASVRLALSLSLSINLCLSFLFSLLLSHFKNMNYHLPLCLCLFLNSYCYYTNLSISLSFPVFFNSHLPSALFFAQ